MNEYELRHTRELTNKDWINIIYDRAQKIISSQDTDDFFNIEDGWNSFRYAARIFTRLGFPEKAAIMEVDSNHHYTREHHESTIRWMLRGVSRR